MPRVVNEEEHAIRRNEILDAAQQLLFSKGYEQTSIQDIISALGMSKGAFYHYFDSKPNLLDALTRRTEEEIFRLLTPIIHDGNLSAQAKLERFFGMAARWKAANKAYLMAILRVWYDDNNAVLRQRMVSRGFKRVMPLLMEAIQQGMREGTMQAEYNPHIAEVLIALMLGMGDATAKALLELKPDSSMEEREACFQKMVESVQAFTQAIERVLGAEKGSMVFFDLGLLREWVLPLEEAPVEKVQSLAVNS